MKGANRDTLVSLVLLLICGVFIAASFEIRETSFGQMESTVWPRIILAALTLLALVYLGQSLGRASTQGSGASRGLRAWLSRYRNAFWCYGLFLAFLLSLPVLGMLIGGTLLVFQLLGALGGWSPRQLALHAAIALVAVGGVWSLFTFGLGVILPQGEILGSVL